MTICQFYLRRDRYLIYIYYIAFHSQRHLGVCYYIILSITAFVNYINFIGEIYFYCNVVRKTYEIIFNCY